MSTVEWTLEPTEQLRQGYAEARRAGAARHRDIANTLGVSEGELIAAHVGASGPGLRSTRLQALWPRTIEALQGVGEVMALTRNASCVHEKTGPYRDVSAQGPAGREMGLALGEIDLRLFFAAWAFGYSVEEDSPRSPGGVQRSLQFFDRSGAALHKVFTREGTDLPSWAGLVARWTSEDQHPGLTVQPPAAPAPEKPDAAIDRAAFQRDWASLRDTHDFFGMTKRHGVSRTQALRLAEPRFVQRVDTASAQQLLAAAAADGTPIMVFVGNPGCIQIHSGPVHRVEVMGPWLNVLDARFNLHLREDHIHSAWVVRKPTVDGLVSSLELFDAQGETIAMFFGERKPGRAELCAWRELISQLMGDPTAFEAAPCTP